ncbi:glycosyltransferase [Rarobacter faecitabidus]|uniref:glycosyltransferase n=1 Tax=Rarobacter faecitabidus TaxID=13243 RepID=UPI0031D22285
MPAKSRTQQDHCTAAAEMLIEAGLFDMAFYSSIAGRQFKTEKRAARHYVMRGMRHHAPCHPLLMPGALPLRIRQSWKHAEVADVIRELRKPSARKFAWSPLFDPRALAESDIDQDVLTTFATWDRDRALPLAWSMGRTLTLNAVSDDVARIAAELMVVRRRRRMSRTTSKSPVADISALKERIAHASLPSDEGRPLVSVVMPVWNRAEIMLPAVRSVLNQTLTDVELVIVDDGSTDGTADVLRELAQADERVKPLEGEHRGVSAARNIGLGHATGRFIAFLDSDNEWRSDFLATIVGAMHLDGLDAAYGIVHLVSDAGDEFLTFEGGLDDLLVRNHIDMNALVVRAEIAQQVGGFDESLRRWVDHDFAIRLARVAEPRLVPVVAVDYRQDADHDRITNREAGSWQYVVLSNNWCRWDLVESSMAERVAGRVSVLIPAYHEYEMTARAVETVLQCSAGHDVEIVVTDNGSYGWASIGLTEALYGLPNVRIAYAPTNLQFAGGSNLAFARSTGDTVVFLNNDTEVRDGWLQPLLDRLQDPQVRGVQPLLLYGDDTIQAAGTVFPAQGVLGMHLLAGFSRDDAAKISDQKFAAVTAAAVALRAEEVVEMRGFDPIFINGMEDIDLCLRMQERWGGHFEVATDAVVTHLESKTPGRGRNIAFNRGIFYDRWRGRMPGPDTGHFAAAGLEIAKLGVDVLPHPAPRPLLLRASGSDRIGEYRWSIKNPANPGPRGDKWGDTHYIAALRDALVAQGQDAVSLRHGAHAVPTTTIDDVNLVIRGLDRGYAHPGQINVLWVISHPELVTENEIAEFDLVFAASRGWAARMSERTGRDVRVLYQATDPELFAPADPSPAHASPADASFADAMPSGIALGRDVVFVGQARPTGPRKIVMDALAAGLDVQVWGPRWGTHIPAEHWRGEFLPNDQLAPLYRASGVILNDHHADMAAHGFIANRIFDALAAGARVISDPVDGLDEVFGTAVQTYSTVEDLRRLGDPAGWDAIFGSDEQRRDRALQVAAEHSFAARARTLVDAVREFDRRGR